MTRSHFGSLFIFGDFQKRLDYVANVFRLVIIDFLFHESGHQIIRRRMHVQKIHP